MFIDFELEEPPQQLMPEFLIDYSSVVVVGRAKTPSMAMFKDDFHSRLLVTQSLGILITSILFLFL